MPPKLYELRVYRGDREVRTAARIRDALDLVDVEKTKDLLRRHLLAAAERDGAARDRAHLYHLDVYELHNNRADRDALFAYALPVQEA